MQKACKILMIISIIVVVFFSLFGGIFSGTSFHTNIGDGDISEVEIERVSFVNYPSSLSVGETRTVTIRITYDVGDYQYFTSSNVEKDLKVWSSNNLVFVVVDGYSISEIVEYWWDDETDFDSVNTEKTYEVSFSIYGMSSGYESIYVEVARDRTVTQYRSIRVTSW